MTIRVAALDRPSIRFEEVRNSEGAYLPGRSVWSVVGFESDLNIFDHQEQYDEVVLILGSETWKFLQARIYLAPNSTDGKFIMAFEKCHRMVANS